MSEFKAILEGMAQEDKAAMAARVQRDHAKIQEALRWALDQIAQLEASRAT